MDIVFNSSSKSATGSVSIVACRNFVGVDSALLSAVSVLMKLFLAKLFSLCNFFWFYWNLVIESHY